MTETPGKETRGRRPAAPSKDVVVAGLAGFALFFVVGGAILGSGSPETEQPIQFNHRIHVVDNEMECSECHLYYEKETFSGLPSRETCEFCHDEASESNVEEQRLVELLQSGEPLEWKPLFRQPPHVFYSHRRHVQAGEMKCETCHGDIGQSETPPGEVTQLTMDDCIDCHETERGAAAECTTCHR